MTDLLLADAPTLTTSWHRACLVEDLEPAWGEAVLVEGHQVALFHLGSGQVYAVTHRDPATGAHVMARGITGSKSVPGQGQRETIASPLHKQVYDLETGACYSNPALHLQTFGSRLLDGWVEIELPG